MRPNRSWVDSANLPVGLGRLGELVSNECGLISSVVKASPPDAQFEVYLSTMGKLEELHSNIHRVSARETGAEMAGGGGGTDPAMARAISMIEAVERYSNCVPPKYLRWASQRELGTTDRPSASSLQALHTDMTTLDETLWPGGAGTGRLRYIFAVSHVDGLDRGLYELLDGQFVLLTPFVPKTGLRDAVLQPEFGDAAAVLLVTGSLLEAVENRGEHGHRILLSRAGAACEIAWLRVLQRGYDASIFAGFLPSMLRLHLGLDGYAQTQLLALAIGIERERE